MQGRLAGNTLNPCNRACGITLRHMHVSRKAAHAVVSSIHPQLHSACRPLNRLQGHTRRRQRATGSPHMISYQVTSLQSAPASGPDIHLLKPHLQQQWDHKANAWLGKKLVHPHTNQKVQWVCTKCPHGHAHVWQSTVNNRSDGSGCPYCAGQAVCQHNALATLSPSIASEWDFDANQLTPHDYTCHSNAVVGWRCSSCQHSWNTHIHRRTLQLAGCPECAAQKRRERTKQPSLTAAGARAMQHWDHKRNAAEGLNPANITLGSIKKVHWLCLECPMGVPHRWCVSPNARFKSSGIVFGCPCCSQPKKQACKCNSLQTLYPEIAAEWDFTKNYNTPDDYTAYSYQNVWWTNDKRGSWQQSIRLRTEPAYRRLKKLHSKADVLSTAPLEVHKDSEG